MTGVAVVIPAKSLSRAKSRLAPLLSAAARADLARAMVGDVLAAALAAPPVATVLLVTADAELAALARHAGARVLTAAEEGYSAAAAAGLSVAAAESFATAAVLPGDIPRLDPATLADLLAAHARGSGVTLVPARDGGGTNALVLSPPGRLRPAFGPQSFARHRAAALAEGIVALTPEIGAIGLDIDVPADLAALDAIEGGAPRTRAVLDTIRPVLAASLGVSP